MYPDFYHVLKDLFGLDFPRLSLLKTFGFMVAMAFLGAGYIIYLELKRKEAQGKIGFTIDEVEMGKPVTAMDYVVSALIGFLLGYKALGMLIDFKTASPDPMSFLFSSKGNLIAGIVLAAVSLGLKFYTAKKESAVGHQRKKVKTYPHMRVADVAVIAAGGGFAGAKIFNALETWQDFVRDPLGSLLSSSGLTFYGGLIVATFALWYYARRIKLDFRYLCDAAAPALIIGYAIGRLGCQVSGDGDWGIYNSAYITNAAGKVEATSQPFELSVKQHEEHVYRHFERNEVIPHASFKAFGGLPLWLFAYNYPKNVNHVGEPLANCEGEYCNVLPIPVFPTPVYEFLMCSLIFVILWSLRKRFDTPLSMFSIYLMLNGIERFLIEQIRVNSTYDWGFMHPTQAEIIAVIMFICGGMMFALRKKIDANIEPYTQPSIVTTNNA